MPGTTCANARQTTDGNAVFIFSHPDCQLFSKNIGPGKAQIVLYRTATGNRRLTTGNQSRLFCDRTGEKQMPLPADAENGLSVQEFHLFDRTTPDSWTLTTGMEFHQSPK